MTLNEEKILRSVIREMVEEFVSDFYNEADEDNKKNSDSSKKPDSKDRDGKPGQESDDRVGSMQNKRRAVLDILKNKYIDCAPYAYDLWPSKAAKGKKGKANARSQFYKCRDAKKNDNGDYYSFTDSEINHLYSRLTTIDTNK